MDRCKTVSASRRHIRGFVRGRQSTISGRKTDWPNPSRDFAGASKMAKRADFFISYTKSDRAWAEWIAWTLEEAGYTTVNQAWDFGPGTNFVLKMNEATRTSKQILMVLSKAYLRSRFANSEWAAGFVDDPEGTRKRLLPVRVGKSPPHPLLKALVYTDLVDATEAEARERLINALNPRAKPEQAPVFPGTGKVTAPAAPRPAYPGEATRSSSTDLSGSHGERPSSVTFETLFRSVADRPVAETPAGHAAEATRLLTSGKLVPFLGLGVHFEVADKTWGKEWAPSSNFFPSPREYGNYLSQYLGEIERVESGTELARVYQYLDETRGRVFVQSAVHRLYDRDYPSKTAHAFFASLNGIIRASGRGKPLPLLITTNLDDVLEQTFRSVGEPFTVVSYIATGDNRGQLRFRSTEGQTQVLRTVAHVKRAAQTEATMILKLHGGVDRSDPDRESMLLNEDELVSYFGSAAALELLPELLRARVGIPRFLFLGYSLRDWNIRFLLARLWSSRRQDMSWAVLYNASRVSKTLWGKRGVEILDVPIEGYLATLAQEIASAQDGPSGPAQRPRR